MRSERRGKSHRFIANKFARRSYVETLTYFTILDLMESSGAFWTFITISLGLLAVTINREKSDQSLRRIFNKHGHKKVDKYFNRKEKERAGFNWKSQRDFVELLMRDREDSLLEHKEARERALKELDEKAEKNRRLIQENKEILTTLSTGASGLGLGE